MSKIQVWLDDVQICKDGGAAEDYTEEAGARVMAQTEITIRVDLYADKPKTRYIRVTYLTTMSRLMQITVRKYSVIIKPRQRGFLLAPSFDIK